MERRRKRGSGRVSPSLVSQLWDLQEQWGDVSEELQYTAGYRRGIEDAIGLAEGEELRVRGVIESHDGTCLDDEEERKRFIEDLYGAGDSN